MAIFTVNTIKSLAIKCFSFAPYRVSLSFLLILISSVMSGLGIALIIPLLASVGVDVGVSSSKITSLFNSLFTYLGIKQSLVSVLALYAILISLVAGIAFLNTVISSSLQQSFVVHLRAEMSRTLFFTKWRFLSQAHMPDFVRLLTNQVQVVSSCLGLIMRLGGGVILLLVYLALSFYISVKLTLTALFCGAVLVGVIWPVNHRIHVSGGVGLTSSRGLYRSVFENLVSLKIIKSYTAEEPYLDHLHSLSKEMELQQIKMAKYNAFTRFVNTLGAAIIFSLLFYTAIEWLEVPVANLLVMFFIFSRLMPHLASIQSTAQSLIHRAPTYTDFLTQLNELDRWQESQGSNGAITFRKSIVLKNVSFTYLDQQESALQDVSTSILCKQTVAITGCSGAGKSTLADLISGLLEPSSGKIFIDDIELSSENRRAWRAKVAYVTQDLYLSHDTVRKNLTWANGSKVRADSNTDDHDIWNALELAAAADFVRALPSGLDTLIGDRGAKLSGGECQRLVLARALLAQPEVLILDEATSALDSQSELKIKQALLGLEGKITIIIIAHNEATIEHVKHRINLRTL